MCDLGDGRACRVACWLGGYGLGRMNDLASVPAGRRGQRGVTTSRACLDASGSCLFGPS